MFKKTLLATLIGLSIAGGAYATKEKPAQVDTTTQTTQAPTTTKVNLNTANAKALEALPHVGEKIALRIVDYRNKNGDFKTFEDLAKVRGISLKRVDTIKKDATLA